MYCLSLAGSSITSGCLQCFHSLVTDLLGFAACSSSQLLLYLLQVASWLHTQMQLHTLDFAVIAGDSPVQSINSCLAMQHLAQYAHAVVLLDNQALLDQLASESTTTSSSSSSKAHLWAAQKPATAAGAQLLVLCMFSACCI
jgi:hypothetical protein